MSKQRSLRKPKLSFEEDDVEDDVGIALPPASVKAAQLKAKKDKRPTADNKKASLLSFQETPGEDISVSAKEASIKPPRIGLRVAPSTRAPPVSTATYTQRSAAGEYSADRLKELQQGMRRLPITAATPDGAFKLSGNFISGAAPKDDRFQHNIDAAGTITANTMPLPPPPLLQPKPPAYRSAAQASVPMVMEAGISEEEDSEGAIPDNATIRRAKAKRELLRTGASAAEYIPMASVSTRDRLHLHSAGQMKGNVASLLGEERGDGAEEDIGSDAEAELEETMRLRFLSGHGDVGKKQEKERRGWKTAGAAARLSGEEDVEDEEEDEAAAAWAEEQIKKGMQSGLLRSTGLPSSKISAGAKVGTQGGAAAVPSIATAVTLPSQAAAVAADADAVLSSLQIALQRARLSKKQAEKNLAKTERSLEDCTMGISKTEVDIKETGDKYVYMQQLRAYLADLCGMLAEKSPLVEELQEELARLREERALVHAQRREIEDLEETEPASAATTAALSVLSQGGALTEAETAATAAAAEADERVASGAHIPVELDEFGRDMNAQRRAQTKARITARAQRRARQIDIGHRKVHQEQGQHTEKELAYSATVGYVTSSESEGEVLRYAARAGEVEDAAGAVFRDADDEFKSLAAVKSKLEGWKAKYPGQYNDAFVSLSAPALFAPFIRLELLSWAPLETTAQSPSTINESASFDRHDWYHLLFEYGMHPESAAGAEHGGEDPDADLVPRLVRSLVLPLAERLLESVWDPRSARQSKAAAALLEDLLIYVPPDTEGLQRALKSVQERLEGAVASTSVPSWPPAALAASSRAEAHLAWQFGRAVRLLRSICAFSEVLPAVFVQKLALEHLVQQHLLPYVRAAAADPAAVATRAARILDALPPAWFASGVPRGLESLVELLKATTRSLEMDSGDPAKREAVPAVRKLAGVLSKLGHEDIGQRLALMYGVA